VANRFLVTVGPMHVEVLIPILDDWESVGEVIMRLDRAFAASPDSLAIILVDDGSTTEPSPGFGSGVYTKLNEISILRLKKNLGHQRALATGLCYVAEKIKCDAVLVMDGDGEDEATDAVRLVEKMKQIGRPTVIFAERMRRSESAAFRCGYAAFKVLHLVLTGQRIRVGNFSAVPAFYLERIAVEPMLWNHYAASIMRARLPVAYVPTQRGKRIQGGSRLNFVSLVVHGLSALACYSEVIGVRLIFCSGAILFLDVVGSIALLSVKSFTTLAIPGWTSLLLSLILISILQIATLVSNFTMQIISQRSTQPFLPARDYSWFVSRFETLYTKPS
jgi:glycosyltransferase involved in cell wall biosynthesis